MKAFSIAPREFFASAWAHRNLIRQMIRREVLGRYRGSVLGIFWSFFNPILMLLVYTFVFGVVFKARWIPGSESRAEFALTLFAGMIVFNLFSECINRAPGLILSNANYVKKVVFPLEILPWVALGSAIFHLHMNLIVWLLFYLVFWGLPAPTIFLFPAILLPLSLLTLGMSLFLASLGVYLRDVGQVIGVVVTVLMFLSPVFYPLSSIPAAYQPLLLLNPLTVPIEQGRDVLVFGRVPDLGVYIFYLVICTSIAWLGFAWFQKTRRGFADVV